MRSSAAAIRAVVVPDSQAVGAECDLDAAGEVIDELGELGDGVQSAVFAPAGDIRDDFAGDVQAEAAQHDQGGGVDDDFGVGSRVALAVDSEGVNRLVDERAQARVRGSAGVDDDLLGLGVAPAAGAAGDRLRRDGVAEGTRRRRSSARSGGRANRR